MTLYCFGRMARHKSGHWSGDPGDHWIISVSGAFWLLGRGREAVWQIHTGSYLLLCYPFLAANCSQSQDSFWLVSSSFHLFFLFSFGKYFFFPCKLPFSAEQELHWPWAMRCSGLCFPLCPQLFSYSIIWSNPVLLHGCLSSSSRSLLSLVREWRILFCCFCWKFANDVWLNRECSIGAFFFRTILS